MATYIWTSKAVNPTVEHFTVSPQFKTIVTEFDSGKRVRNSKWDTPRYRFTIKYRTPVAKADMSAIKDFFIARKGIYESFQIYAAPLGTTHTVTFDKDVQDFDYFANLLGYYGTVSFIEEVI
jgi:hypothetical protein